MFTMGESTTLKHSVQSLQKEGAQLPGAQILALLFLGHITLENVFNLDVAPFPYLLIGIIRVPTLSDI